MCPIVQIIAIWQTEKNTIKKIIKFYIKFYIDDENGKMREITNQNEFFTSLREAKDYAYEIVEKKWFYTKRKLFGIVFGINKEAKIKYILVPEEEKKNILKNIDKYPEKNIENKCVLVEVLKGNY